MMGQTTRKTTEWFIQQAQQKHGDRYGYTPSVYVSMHDKVEIICPKPNHGIFHQGARDHLRGQGCPVCSKERVGERIAKAIAAHSGKAWNKGIAATEEQKTKQSKLMTQKYADGHQHPMQGKSHTEKTKSKITESLTGFRHTAEAKKNMTEAQKRILAEGGKTQTPMVVDGRNFRSLREACEFYDLTPTNVSGRLRGYGWSVEEAFGIKPRTLKHEGREGCIYKITNTVDGRVYIGTTISETVEKRWNQHVYKAMARKNNTALSQSIREHGKEMFRIEVLETYTDHHQRRIREDELIIEHKARDPLHGLNTSMGGALGAVGVGNSIEVAGVVYPSYTAALNAYGVSYIAYYQRIVRGWDRIRAITTPPVKNGRRKKTLLDLSQYGIHDSDRKIEIVLSIDGKTANLKRVVLAEQRGYRVITLFEDEWLNKKDIVVSRLKNIFGLSPRGVGARKLRIDQIAGTRAHEFVDLHHIQGRTTSIQTHLGAFHEDRLIAVMQFGNDRNNQYCELKRFTTDGAQYPGVASKMFQYYVREFTPESVVSFADRRWSQGDLYLKLGFVEETVLAPDYFYVKGTKRFHKSGFRKSLIAQKHHIDVSNKTETQLMQELNYKRVWDCGKIKFKWSTSV